MYYNFQAGTSSLEYCSDPSLDQEQNQKTEKKIEENIRYLIVNGKQIKKEYFKNH